MATDYRILLFGGTDEGRKIAARLANLGIPALVCVATEYGENLLGEDVSVRRGRLNGTQMLSLMREHNFSLCIDATHPYADEVSKNIKSAAETAEVKLLRVVRTSAKAEYGMEFNSMQEIAEYLLDKEGNVFVTTGSKELAAFSPLSSRVFARVLPDAEVIKKCNEAGFSGRNLICMQGPFSADLNAAIMREINAKFLVTKESGRAGGFDEKVRAAAKIGAQILILKRPSEETGMELDEIFEIIEKLK